MNVCFFLACDVVSHFLGYQLVLLGMFVMQCRVKKLTSVRNGGCVQSGIGVIGGGSDSNCISIQRPSRVFDAEALHLTVFPGIL